MFKKAMLVLCSLAIVAFFAGCKGDEGATGPAGTAECFQCHGDNSAVPTVKAQWEHSRHGIGETVFEGSRQPCAPCHSGNGFKTYLETGVATAQTNPSLIDCFTCHSPHENFNFSLRTTDPVTLRAGGTFNLGNGNLCVNCHQARATNPLINPSGNTVIKSFRWGPHYGSQGNVLAGQSAFVFSGATYSNSPHTTVATDGCPMCHMADPIGVEAGGHSVNMVAEAEGEDNVSGCNQTGCHSSVDDFSFMGVQDSVEALLAALRADLIAAAILDTTDYPRVPTGDSLVLAPNQAGALYNYKLFEYDRSMGIHNTQYAYDVLNASIAALAARGPNF